MQCGWAPTFGLPSMQYEIVCNEGMYGLAVLGEPSSSSKPFITLLNTYFLLCNRVQFHPKGIEYSLVHYLSIQIEFWISRCAVLIFNFVYITTKCFNLFVGLGMLKAWLEMQLYTVRYCIELSVLFKCTVVLKTEQRRPGKWTLVLRTKPFMLFESTYSISQFTV